jgi:hypothetical protein
VISGGYVYKKSSRRVRQSVSPSEKYRRDAPQNGPPRSRSFGQTASADAIDNVLFFYGFSKRSVDCIGVFASVVTASSDGAGSAVETPLMHFPARGVPGQRPAHQRPQAPDRRNCQRLAPIGRTNQSRWFWAEER